MKKIYSTIKVPAPLLAEDYDRPEQILYLYCTLKRLSMREPESKVVTQFKTLSESTGMCFRTIKRGLAFLDEQGYLRVTAGKNRTLLVEVLV